MFEFLFKYPASVFSKGTFVLLGAWPRWMLFAGIVAIAVLLAWLVWRKRNQLAPSLRGFRVLSAVGLAIGDAGPAAAAFVGAGH